MNTFIENSCDKEWQEFISFHKKVITFKKGDFIFKAGEKTKGLYIIDAGKIKVTYRQYDGSDRLIRLAKTGDVLGHRGFGGSWKYPISAMALDDVQVSFIPVNVFNVLAKSDPKFTYQLMMFFAEELRKSEAKIKHYPVRIQVARAILDNYKAFGFENENSTKLSYTLSRKDIANKAGTTYETVVRNVAELNKTGIVKIDGKSLHILDLEGLRRIARPVYSSE
ncbi:MAG: Crp/Fnr family transcriptional regulator [Fluviicola sp.]|nr:Crp/Fnr family transcriptional regulator [Fluviicola sp.]